MLGVPLQVDRRAIGVMHIGTLVLGEFDEDDIDEAELQYPAPACRARKDRLEARMRPLEGPAVPDPPAAATR
jgi:hypothetical protein